MEEMPSNTPVTETKPGPAGWLQIWIKVLTKPGEQTFSEIAESPEAKIQTAFLWAAMAGFVGGIGSGISYALRTLIQGSGGSSSGMGTIVGYICGFPIALAIINPISLAFSSALFYWVAKLFKGSGSYEKLVYLLAAITVPFTVISALLTLFTAIPYVVYCAAILSILMMFYVAYLNITAVKAVNHFGWGEAIGSVLIPSFAIGLICGCLVFFSMILLMPLISKSYGLISSGLVF